MAVPKRKTSKARKRKRQANKAFKLPNLAIDPVDGTRYPRHRINPHNGMYRGKQIVTPEVEDDL